MLKPWLNAWAHDVLRNRAHRGIDGMDAGQVRDAIHRATPLVGRILTLAIGAEAQRETLHTALAGMSRGELRAAAGDRLPPRLQRLLEWLDR